MVVGFENYQVSDEGRVRSVWRGRLMHGSIEFNRNKRVRSIRVTLKRNGRAHYRRVHHLVLEAFVGPRPNGMEACHNDGNPLNNCVENLRWDSHSENMADQEKHGTRVNPPTYYGEKHHNVTISDADVAAIRKHKYRRGLYSELARQHGVAPITIRRIYKGASR